MKEKGGNLLFRGLGKLEGDHTKEKWKEMEKVWLADGFLKKEISVQVSTSKNFQGSTSSVDLQKP